MMIISKGRKSVSIVDQLFLSFSISSSDSSPQTLGGDRNDKVFFCIIIYGIMVQLCFGKFAKSAKNRPLFKFAKEQRSFP